MSDSEYDSEDDDDYIPEEPSSEEELGITDVADTTTGKREKKHTLRKRKGGIRLEENEKVSSQEESEDEDQEEQEDKIIAENEELKQKKRDDDLWAAFKRDTAAVRPATSSSLKRNAEKVIDEIQQEKASTSSVVPKDVPKKVEITETFDFAGEEVKITKSIDASSVKHATSRDEDKPPLKPTSAVPLKRSSGGLSSVLGKIGKKPKLSTLEKSKLDWNSFKQQEGIEDELRTRNRDGYLEKQAFLNRVDHKQFEIERDIRQGFRKK